MKYSLVQGVHLHLAADHLSSTTGATHSLRNVISWTKEVNGLIALTEGF